MPGSGERERIRVAHFVESWLPQTATWLYNHVKSLPEEIETHVVCQGVENLDQFPMEDLVSLRSYPLPRRLVTKLLCRLGMQDYRESHLGLLEEVVRRLKPDLLHSHFGHFGWVNSRLARECGLRHVVSFYGADIGYVPRMERRWASRYRQMSDQVDLVLCEGPHMARSIADLGLDPKKIKVFRLGIDLARLPFLARKNPVGSTIRFLIAGAFREKKGIPYALEALGQFRKIYPDIEVTIIGDSRGSEREEREKRKILDQLERSELRARTRLLGFQAHEVLIGEYYRHDIFISPSVVASDGDTEGGAPVTIIEAAASGMPVVSTHHCDIPFVLSERNQPYLVAERDSLGLSRAVEALVHCAKWDRIVSENRRFIVEELDVRKQAQKLANLYRLMTGKTTAEEQAGFCRF